MLPHIKLQNLNDYFKALGSRPQKGVYFYRICSYNDEIASFITKYYTAARSGAIIEGKIPNPDENNLSYYNEMLGSEFQNDADFIKRKLQKWLPRMNTYQVTTISEAIHNTLCDMKQKGKSDSILKNCYIKFMCWLYYKFERIVSLLGSNNVPKIIYDGEISNHELLLLSILSKAGCDIVLLECNGDDNYLRYDPQSALSDKLMIPSAPFPKDFSLKTIRENMIAAAKQTAKKPIAQPKPQRPVSPVQKTSTAQKNATHQKIPVPSPRLKNDTNLWTQVNKLDSILIKPDERGVPADRFYNIFTRINGVWDKSTYANDLYQTYAALKQQKRNVVIIENKIPVPTPQEINGIRRQAYDRADVMIYDLSKQIRYDFNEDLRNIMVKNFIELLSEEMEHPDISLNKLTNKAVYLLCWIKRYAAQLFTAWKQPDIGCFIYLGGCKDQNEELLLRYLSKLPIDVVILVPDLNEKCLLTDKCLCEQNFQESDSIHTFPSNPTQIRVGTVAYHAERELDTLLYQDSGMYRNQQYAKANTITLNTMYEEISQLWDQELKYRPNFDTSNETVTIPVICAKISGVKDGNESAYWSTVKTLVTPETIVFRQSQLPMYNRSSDIMAVAPMFFRNKKLMKTAIKEHKSFRYGHLRPEIIDYMLDKLEILINSQIINGTSLNGTEYVIIATVLNLPDNIIQHIQSFDFTKKNPKLLYINTGETVMSLEESIVIAYLNLIGFDIVCFVPTGYQCVEKHFSTNIMEEHQIGQYMYNMTIPNLESSSVIKQQFTSLKNRIFGRR